MSDIQENIRKLVNDALRQGDKERLGALRMLSAAIGKEEKDSQKPMTEEGFVNLLNRLRKQHQASMDQFKQAGRTDLYEKEYAEKKVIESLLPEQLSGEELEKLIDQAISDSQAAAPQDIGKVMGQLKQKVHGKADMSEVSRLVKEKLA